MRSIASNLKRKLYLIVAGYFRFWAKRSLGRWNPRIIAVTGSVGKTTMLHLLELQLEDRAHYSHFANSIYGICFDIVGLRGVTSSKLQWLWLIVAVPIRSIFFTHKQEFYVVEVDADRPKETEYIARWLKPEVTLWVSLGRSHAVNFDELVAGGKYSSVDEAIAREFSWLARLTHKLVIYDGDNALIDSELDTIKVKKRAVTGRALQDYKVWPDHTVFTIGGEELTVPYPVPREMFKQLAMLDVISKYLGLQLLQDFSGLTMPPGRNSFFAGKQGTKLIDSSYNAHLISVESMVDMFREMKATHKWLVISDIIELGVSEAEHHERLGEILANVKADRYILIGRRTRQYTLPVLKRLGKGEFTKSFLKISEASKFIDKNIKGKETILFKGSQYLESIIEELLLNPADVDKLARREVIATKRRKGWETK